MDDYNEKENKNQVKNSYDYLKNFWWDTEWYKEWLEIAKKANGCPERI